MSAMSSGLQAVRGGSRRRDRPAFLAQDPHHIQSVSSGCHGIDCSARAAAQARRERVSPTIACLVLEYAPRSSPCRPSMEAVFYSRSVQLEHAGRRRPVWY